MNANELADELKTVYCEVGDERILDAAATMLRQQQAEIESLKANFNKQNPVKEVFNKPVAYRWKSDLGYIYDIYDHGGGEPMFTHPAELTDEEILQVMMNVYSDTVPPIRGIDFAKAILRKASEK